jgi:uncharacterized protein YjiS (DUF1127 family)
MVITTLITMTTHRAPQGVSWPRRAAVAIAAAWHRSRDRQHLAALDARALRDIGVTPYDAAREAEKWFWRR